MSFLSLVFITPSCMIKIYFSKKEIHIKQIKIESKNFVKAEPSGYTVNIIIVINCDKDQLPNDEIILKDMKDF